MDYDCQLAIIDKLPVGAIGTIPPLCNDCKTPDCTNPIREFTISVFGIPRKMRLWVVNNQIRQVVSCKGYVGEKDVVLDPEDEFEEEPDKTV
jgi:hypothetical protein